MAEKGDKKSYMETHWRYFQLPQHLHKLSLYTERRLCQKPGKLNRPRLV
jgi:hypothetical protein